MPIDTVTLERLSAYGVTTVELGCQSMDDGVLERAERGHSHSDVIRACGCLRADGFSVILQMMTGLPETAEQNPGRRRGS